MPTHPWIRVYTSGLVLLLVINVLAAFLHHQRNQLIAEYWRIVDDEQVVTIDDCQSALAEYTVEVETIKHDPSRMSTDHGLTLHLGWRSNLQFHAYYDDADEPLEFHSLVYAYSTKVTRERPRYGPPSLWTLGVGVMLPMASLGLVFTATAKQRKKSIRRLWLVLSILIAVLPSLTALFSLVDFGLGI